jgi:hypothetical protein
LSFCWIISCYYWLLFLSWRDLCTFQSNGLDLTFIFRKEKITYFPKWVIGLFEACTWSLSETFKFYMIWFIFHSAFMLLIYLFPISDHNFNISIVPQSISGSCNGQIVLFFLYFLYHLFALLFGFFLLLYITFSL